MFTRKAGIALIMLTGALLGCNSGYGTAAPQPQGSNAVAATNALVFTPATLHVSVGDQVTFSFGSVGHNVFFATQAGAPADIPGTNANVAIERQFTTTGTYTYACHIHPSMQGTIVVQ